MSRVVVRNRTEYPDEEVTRIVRTVFSGLELPDPATILVRVSYTRLSEQRRQAGERYLYGASGKAWPYVFVRKDTPKNAAYETHLSIGRPEDFPCSWFDRYSDARPVGELRDWREALVAIAAHEGKHIEIFQTVSHRKRHRRSMGLSGRLEEARCDSAAAKALADYRKEQP